MITNVTAGGVYWNEAHRLPELLGILKVHFSHVVVVIQESTDDSLAIARRMLDRRGDRVRTDEHRGAGDPSFPILCQTVETPWTFVVSGDEMPSADLLVTIPRAITAATMDRRDGVWVQFHSTIEGIDFTNEQDRHLRLFRNAVGWPAAILHSRPMTENTMLWPIGYISHDRSLDEMVEDYLRYLAMGRDSAPWTAHNVQMLRGACESVAEHIGWTDITTRSWWPEVRAAAFGGIDPQ
jgi:hypothetical protein